MADAEAMDVDLEKDAAMRAAVEQKAEEVSRLVAAKSMEEALREAVADPPVDTKDAEIKAMAARTVLEVISASKDSEVDTLLSKLDDEGEDVLMKYLYALLEGAEECAKLLKWHEKLVKKSGLGCIVRALTDRKTVMRAATGQAGAAAYAAHTR